ncbi:hypothetical protein FRY77_37985 [Halomonas sp. MG34]|nr:hypothetical protein [Halomonas sp. MG34]
MGYKKNKAFKKEAISPIQSHNTFVIPTNWLFCRGCKTISTYWGFLCAYVDNSSHHIIHTNEKAYWDEDE